MKKNQFIIEKYRDKPLALVTYKTDFEKTVGLDFFIDESKWNELIEQLDNGELILTQEGVDFIREYFGFEGFLSTIKNKKKKIPSANNRLASGIKWILQRTTQKHGIDIKKAEMFDVVDSDRVNDVIAKYDEKILARGMPPFNKRYPEIYFLKHFMDPVTLLFFFDKLDSAEAKLTEDGLNFLKEIYGWEQIIMMIEFLHASGFILRYNQPEDIVLWLQKLGEFPKDRYEMLLKDGY